MRQTSSAQLAYFRLGSKAGWAVLVRRIETFKWAQTQDLLSIHPWHYVVGQTAKSEGV